MLIDQQCRDDRLSNLMLNQIGRRGRIDHVIGVTRTQEVEEVEAAFAGPGGKPSKAVIADVHGIFLVPGMAGGGVIDRDPGRALQPSFQEGIFLGVKSVLVGGQERHELALGKSQTHGPQLDEEALDRDLSFEVLQQDKTHNPWAEVPGHLGRQWRHDFLTVTQRSRRKRMM